VKTRAGARLAIVCALHLATAIAASVFTPMTARADTFYVAEGGVDGAAGTQGEPWGSIDYAVGQVSAGDTVVVGGGDYTAEGGIWLDTDGGPGLPVRFEATAGETPIVRGFLIRDRQWVEVHGFRIEDTFALPGNWQDMPAVVVDDPSVVIDPREEWSTREAKVYQKYATYMSVMDDMFDSWTNGVDIKNSDHITVSGCTITRFTAGINVRDTSTNITIEDNSFSRCRNAIFSWLARPSFSDSVIRRNHSSQCFSACIDVREGATNIVIEDNSSQHSGTSHISLHSGATGVLIRGNDARHGGYYSEAMTYPGSSAINVHTSGPGNVVDGNFAAFQRDDTLNDGNGFIADLMEPDAPVTFQNNIAYRNMGSGITTTESPACTMVNNLFIENGDNTPSLRNGAGIRFARAEDVGHFIVNNIFVDNKTAGIWTHELLESQQLIDHNLYFSTGGQPFISDSWDLVARKYHSIDEIQQNTSWEDNGLEGDPLFADRAGEDFHLTAGSPAIGEASAVHAPAEDHERGTRDLEPDVGPYEHVPASAEDAGLSHDARIGDAGQADADRSDNAAGDAASPDAGGADAGGADAPGADAVALDSAVADRAAVDSAAPDLTQADHWLDDAAVGDAVSPDRGPLDSDGADQPPAFAADAGDPPQSVSTGCACRGAHLPTLAASLSLLLLLARARRSAFSRGRRTPPG